MAVFLNNGEIVNQCDANTGFITGTANTDIFIEPTASIGAKVSQATTDFYTTTLGATAPYDFSSTGGESGYHIIIWLNVLGTPSATDGGRIIVGNGTSRAVWYVPFPSGYTGGFQPRVINTAANFDLISAGSWTLAGNPAQLTNITQMGGGFNVTSKITGNFSNVGVDMFTIGTGLRVDGTGNSFETIRIQDEDTTRWGWMTSSAGSYISRGGIFLGPATGTATSSFSDSAEVLIFADERVASDFYKINARGSNTTVSFTGCIIRAENSTNSRWQLNIDGASQPSFNDTGSLFQGFSILTLQSDSTLNGTSLDDGQRLVQNSATIVNCSISNADTSAVDDYFIDSNNPSNISYCDFTFSNKHAIRISTPGTYTFEGNTFNGYDSTNGTQNTAIFNDSGGLVTLNITGGGSTPSYKNGIDGTTVINQSVNITVKILNPSGNPVSGSQVAIFRSNGSTILSSTPTNENGEVSTSSSASIGGIVIRARQSTNIANFLTSASGIDSGTDVITTTLNHHFQNGDSVVYTKNGGSANIGLTEGNTYYVRALTATTLTLHNTAAAAIGGTGIINLTASGSETHSLDPVRYISASATGTVGTTDFSAQISLVEDIVAIG